MGLLNTKDFTFPDFSFVTACDLSHISIRIRKFPCSCALIEGLESIDVNVTDSIERIKENMHDYLFRIKENMHDYFFRVTEKVKESNTRIQFFKKIFFL